MSYSNSTSKIGLIILAAGSSSRLGIPKQLVRFQGKTLLQRIVVESLESLCSPIIVVIGNDREIFRQQLENFDVEIVENNDWQRGMGSSISLAIKKLCAINLDLDGVVLCVCDQPFVTADTINNLVNEFQEKKYKIIASAYGETLGVPALFDKKLFTKLVGLEGKNGAKNIIERHLIETFAVDFPQGVIDVDTPEDLKRLQKYSEFQKNKPENDKL